MKHVFSLALLLSFSGISCSQILSNEQEMFDMMTSGKYYYGECTSPHDSTAKAIALSELIARNKNIVINADEVLYYYYVISNGKKNYIYMGAFIPKRETAIDEGKIEVTPAETSVGETETNTDPEKEETEIEFVGGAIFERLSQYRDLPSMLEYMKRLKATRQVSAYGPFKYCTDVKGANWAVFDQQEKLLTILISNGIKHYDFKTKNEVDIGKYTNSSYKLLWFNLYF